MLREFSVTVDANVINYVYRRRTFVGENGRNYVWKQTTSALKVRISDVVYASRP